MNYVTKQVMMSVLRHVLTIVGTALASYGIMIDPSTTEGLVQLIIGLVFASGSTLAGSIQKTKPVVDVLKQDPIDVESTKQAPKGFYLSERSMNNLKGVNKDLVKVMQTAIVNSPYDFVVTEGLRSAAKQAEMLRTKKSQVRHSKHQDGLAVDIMAYDENGNGTWEHKYYDAIAAHVQEVARLEGVDITWGGSWSSLIDAVHFQIEV